MVEYMSGVMKGAETAKAMKESMEEQVHALKEKGIVPCLAIVRVGARPDDLAYERGAKKRMEMVGGECRVHELPETIGQAELEQEFQAVNEDPSVHGILLFRPLPKHLDEEPLKAMINPLKDVDCMSPVNIAKVFSGDESGFAPCTAEAVMKLFEHYGVELSGKRVTVVGRSMVVGKPLAMLLLKANATVTVCHTRTKDLKEACRSAEILAAAAGKAKMITADMIADGAVVADVGINVDEDGALCGDVDFEAVSAKASLISPVPGGVGPMTIAMLMNNCVETIRGREERA